MSDGPVFICGLAFSGKTPLRIALSAHPRLALTRHTAMWQRHAGRYGNLRRPGSFDHCLSALLGDPDVARLAPDRASIEREFRDGPATYAHLFAVVHRQHAERLGKQRWGDQMGMLERYADWVLRAYPAAQMIHMIRDPRIRHAAAASAHRQTPGRLGWETARWRESAALAERNLRRYPGRYHTVGYEALCSDPEATLRTVAAFLEEDFEPAMTAALADVTLDDRHRRMTFTPGRRRSVCWFIERHAEAQMAAHGYAVDTVTGAAARTPWAFTDHWCDRAGMALWRTLHASRVPPEGVR